MLTPMPDPALIPGAPEPPQYGLNFKPTHSLVQLHALSDASTKISSVICTHLSKANFFCEDGEWTCYRRNYLQGAASFALIDQKNNTLVSKAQDTCIVTESGTDSIEAFEMIISCRTTDPKKDARLLQQNSRREKLAVNPPLRATTLPMRRWGSDPFHEETDCAYRFERIQFKSSTSNNGRRRSPQHYHYVVIELWARLSSKKEVLIANRESVGLVVRGRSPSHYTNPGTTSVEEEEDNVSINGVTTRPRAYSSPIFLPSMLSEAGQGDAVAMARSSTETTTTPYGSQDDIYTHKMTRSASRYGNASPFFSSMLPQPNTTARQLWDPLDSFGASTKPLASSYTTYISQLPYVSNLSISKEVPPSSKNNGYTTARQLGDPLDSFGASTKPLASSYTTYTSQLPYISNLSISKEVPPSSKNNGYVRYIPGSFGHQVSSVPHGNQEYSPMRNPYPHRL